MELIRVVEVSVMGPRQIASVVRRGMRISMMLVLYLYVRIEKHSNNNLRIWKCLKHMRNSSIDVFFG